MSERTTADPSQAETPDRDAAGLSPGATVLCEVFRSPRREGMYLYVARSEGLTHVPDSLMERFGRAESALVFQLHGERRLARASAVEVLDALAEQGFYLQMPPGPAGDEDSAPGGAAGTRQAGDPPASAVSTGVDREAPSC